MLMHRQTNKLRGNMHWIKSKFHLEQHLVCTNSLAEGLLVRCSQIECPEAGRLRARQVACSHTECY